MLKHSPKVTFKVQIVTEDEDYIPDFVYSHKPDPLHVIDSLVEDIDLWCPSSSVLLDLPTGTGKNHFVIHHLIPQAMQEHKTVLILSNRVAVSSQQKLSLMAEDDPRRTHLTAAGIRALEDFGDVIVLTYHRLAAFLKDSAYGMWRRRLKYVIADEAHFFVAGARFNSACGYLLKLITSRFRHAIRVYMTATSWDILHPLCEAEQKNYRDYRLNRPWELPRSLIRYWIQPDYSKLQIHFFTAYDAILDEIQRNPSEKWILFVDTKASGKQLAQKLSGCAQYLDAAQKDTEVWQQIVEREQFVGQVLITTSVLDNGVNIRDDAVKHIVIASDDRTEIIQSIGRKRRRANEVVDVRIQIPSDEQIRKRRSRCRVLLDWQDRFLTCVTLEQRQQFLRDIWNHGDSELQKLFIPYCGDLLQNELGFLAIRRKLRFYERVMQRETTFRDEVLRWLDASPEELPPLDAPLREFYQELGNTPLDALQFSKLRSIIVDIYVAAGHKEPQPTRIDKLMDKALNHRLVELNLPYRIQKDQEQYQLIKLSEKGVYEYE